MPAILPRLSLRLAIPAMALCALFALGEPIESNAATPKDATATIAVDAHEDAIVIAIRAEMQAINEEAASAQRTAAHAAASRLRWAMTLPAAGGGKRCLVDSCNS